MDSKVAMTKSWWLDVRKRIGYDSAKWLLGFMVRWRSWLWIFQGRAIEQIMEMGF